MAKDVCSEKFYVPIQKKLRGGRWGTYNKCYDQVVNDLLNVSLRVEDTILKKVTIGK